MSEQKSSLNASVYGPKDLYVLPNVCSSYDLADYKIGATRALFHKLLGEMDTGPPTSYDSALVRSMWLPERFKDAILHLYWRAQMQLIVFDIFVTLVEQQHLPIDVLSLPIDLRSGPPALMDVWTALVAAFPQLRPMHKPPNHFLPKFLFPAVWLAIIIVRGCSDIKRLFAASGKEIFLGHIHRSLRMDRGFCSRLTDSAGKSSVCGFFLPDDVKDLELEKMKETYFEKFKEIEGAFEMCWEEELADQQWTFITEEGKECETGLETNHAELGLDSLKGLFDESF
ncbi:MAG: hypothetical protein M1836_002682 [Candelina mexicana]|nr:MAG: hypothetical protein M1836_002682 [Candelina mexicana]